MDLEQILQSILRAKQDLSRKEVLKKIHEKKVSSGNYLLDEVAAHIVASELGVKVHGEKEALRADIAIRDLVSGLNDVTVIGRIIMVYPTKLFSRSDLTEGKIARLLLADKTGSLWLVLWNDKTSFVENEEIQQGEILRVRHGYVREGLDGKLELHVGERGILTISPSDISEEELPSRNHFIDKIADLSKNGKANVMGEVLEVYPASEFKRRDGTNGKVRRLHLRDDTGGIRIVLWNEKVDELIKVKEGDYLRVMNAKVKLSKNQKLEVHAEKITQIDYVTRRKGSVSSHQGETTHKISSR